MAWTLTATTSAIIVISPHQTFRFVGRLCTSKVGRLCTSDGWSSVHVFVVCFCYFISSQKLKNSSHTTPLISQLTQLVSSHKSHNSSYTSHLSQLVLHNSTYSRAAFVCHLVELLSCSLIEVHPSSFTQLISQLTQLIQYNSTLLTSYRTRLTPLHSSHNSQKSFHITALILQLSQLLSYQKSHNSSLLYGEKDDEVDVPVCA